jgi:hypothetical protein
MPVRSLMGSILRQPSSALSESNIHLKLTVRQGILRTSTSTVSIGPPDANTMKVGARW